MDEVFGEENFVSLIQFRKTAGSIIELTRLHTCDFILWYARQRSTCKVRQLLEKRPSEMVQSGFNWFEHSIDHIATREDRMASMGIRDLRQGQT